MTFSLANYSGAILEIKYLCYPHIFLAILLANVFN